MRRTTVAVDPAAARAADKTEAKEKPPRHECVGEHLAVVVPFAEASKTAC